MADLAPPGICLQTRKPTIPHPEEIYEAGGLETQPLVL